MTYKLFNIWYVFSVDRQNAKTYKVGRSAITGRFMTVKGARQRPRTSVVETMKKKNK